MNKYLDCERYLVRRYDCENGRKVVVIDGFCFENETGLHFVNTIGCYVDVPVQGGREEIENAIDNSLQTQYDMTDDEVNICYGQLEELPITEVTQDTPCGWYVDPNFKKASVRKVKKTQGSLTSL